MRVPKNTISISQVERLLLGVRGTKLDIESLLTEAKIPSVLLEAPEARVPADKFSTLIRILIRQTRDELFWRGGHAVKIGTFNQLCMIMAQGKTLKLAVRDGARFLSTAFHDISPRMDVRAGQARLVLREAAGWTPAMGYTQAMILLFGHGIMSWLIGRRLPCTQISFRYGQLMSSQEMKDLFKAPILYEQPFASLSFDAKWLDLPVVQSRATAERFMHEAPGNLVLGFRDRSTLAEKTRRTLSAHLPEKSLTLEQMADALDLTPATFRKRLESEGCSFQDIKDDLRRDLAIEYLSRRDLTLNQVAELLGFSEQSTFNRAFKAWTGVAPGAYRVRPEQSISTRV